MKETRGQLDVNLVLSHGIRLLAGNISGLFKIDLMKQVHCEVGVTLV
ncbi:MAG TPA: hypothetical protein PLU88_14480 [Armatimonadota bacterium]|nr:hypothetical protein [Armatimonadota bacterium]HPP76325.1 hypothetical protein [Armatimonadota bacterium]